MFGSCMCGDTYCSSCGPAQGNNKCYSCGAWSEDGGCINPEACNELAREQDDAYALGLIEDEKLAVEWRTSLRLERQTKSYDG